VQDPNIFYSPADGTILYQKVVDPRKNNELLEIKGKSFTLNDLMCLDNFNKPCLVIGIFMSFFDVHVNRVPYSGIIKYVDLPRIQTRNIPMLAVEKDLFDGIVNYDNLNYLFYNERRLNKIIIPDLKYTYYILQIADQDVDLILTFHKQKDFITQNERLGMIRYGSQVDLILPLDPRFKFKLMQKAKYHVKAGIDPLVRIIRRKPSVSYTI
jgi:phosphatidylserine decarboxylase